MNIWFWVVTFCGLFLIGNTFDLLDELSSWEVYIPTTRIIAYVTVWIIYFYMIYDTWGEIIK